MPAWTRSSSATPPLLSPQLLPQAPPADVVLLMPQMQPVSMRGHETMTLACQEDGSQPIPQML